MRLDVVKRILAGAVISFALAACGNDSPPTEVAAGDPPPVEQEMPVIGPERTILAFGDSLFAGYDLAEDEGYPERLEMALRAQGINARVIDAGVSGDTTAAGLQRIGFVLDNAGDPPDLAIVELGGNDLLRGIAPSATRENLAAILDELKAREIPVLLMGMRAPPNLGVQFQAEFDGIYPALAEEYDVALVPFFLEAVFDQPQLILPDRIHPTAEGIVALVDATKGAVIEALPPAE
jgi:acyl-CoA thioesterase I